MSEGNSRLILPDGKQFNIWNLFEFKLEFGDIYYEWQVERFARPINRSIGYKFSVFRRDEIGIRGTIQIRDISKDDTEPDLSLVNLDNLSAIAKNLRADFDQDLAETGKKISVWLEPQLAEIGGIRTLQLAYTIVNKIDPEERFVALRFRFGEKKLAIISSFSKRASEEEVLKLNDIVESMMIHCSNLSK